MASSHDHHRLTFWQVLAPLVGLAAVAAAKLKLFDAGSGWFLVLAAVLLLASVFSAVHCAEILALRIGQPFGAVLLALAITVIEVGLIVSVMLAGTSGADTIARDTVYATVMIVLNGIVGLCLVAGGIKYHEQEFRTEGAAVILSAILTLSVIALILPNHTIATLGPSYSKEQLALVGVVSLLLYVMFVFIQSSRHRDYFVTGDGSTGEDAERPEGRVVALSAIMLVAGLFAVIFLAKVLSGPIETSVLQAGLPSSFVGVVIAGIVLLPEGMAAFNAAMRNHLQTSLNASLGSALASIGLTIPAVALLSVFLGQDILLGVSAEQTVLLALSLAASMLSFATGKTTLFQGCVHLVIFGVFVLLSAIP